jgi:hypothetical protein
VLQDLVCVLLVPSDLTVLLTPPPATHVLQAATAALTEQRVNHALLALIPVVECNHVHIVLLVHTRWLEQALAQHALLTHMHPRTPLLAVNAPQAQLLQQVLQC